MMIFVYIWVRWTLPRFRYDQLQKLGWQMLLPLALLNIFITSAIVVALS
jgi:NADH-quinone oxidoreductase subunit H